MSNKTLGRKVIISLAITIALLLGSIPTLASDTASRKIVIKIRATLKMSITSGGRTVSGEKVVTRYDIPELTDRELNQWYVEKEDAASLAISGNVNWKVAVRSEEPTLGISEDGEYEKPVSDLMVRCSGNSFGYQSVSTSPSTIFEGGKGTYNRGLDYKTEFDKAQYKPGFYEATLIYTITRS